MLSNIDWTRKELLILAFDHRGSFLKGLFGIKDRRPTEEETSTIADYKMVIYEGFKLALERGVPKSLGGILVDEQFGAKILIDAAKHGITFALPCEKSGQDEFDFEYGHDFGKHIDKFNPSFAKVLVRYNPDDNKDMNMRQLQRLKQLGDYLKGKNRAYLFELLVPASASQLQAVGGDKSRYDNELRPALMIRAIKEIQDAGVHPDIWKIEGVDRFSDSAALAKQAQTVGHAGVITLGRGESKDKVKEWLAVGAKVPGIIGFAVGRTIFWDALSGLKTGKHDRKKAVEMIAANYSEFVKLWQNERKRGA